MNAWDIVTVKFPGADSHPAVIISHPDRVDHKSLVNVLLCFTQRGGRKPEEHEVLLDAADGLDWATIVKCDLIYLADKKDLSQKRGSVSAERRRQIAARVIQSTALGGI